MKRNKSLLFGLIISMLCISSLLAQNTSMSKDTYKRVYILDLGLGIGFPQLLGDGNSAWHVEKKRSNTVFAPSMQLMTYSPHSNLGYGLLYHNFNSRTNKDERALSFELDEKTSLNYIAPQISLIKRQLGFQNGIMYVNAGVGYASYGSKSMILEAENYKITQAAIGCNLGVAYEYAFDSRLGLRLSANCIYARVKGLHKSASLDELSLLPRKNLHLFVPSVEIGLSYYMVHW